MTEGVVATEEPLSSPLGGHPCAWYRIRAVDPRNGATLVEEQGSSDFMVQAEGSTSRVVAKEGRYWAEARWVPPEEQGDWLSEHPVQGLPDWALPLVAEEWLPLGARARVSGVVQPEPDPGGSDSLYRETGSRQFFTRDKQNPLLITNQPVRELAAELQIGPRLGRFQMVLALIPLLIAAASLLRF
jgi:hypothetical protein